MDCDDVTLLLARDVGSLSDAESDALDEHVSGCETCFQLLRERGAPRVLPPIVDPASFEIGETIAIGGMGRISRAYDRRLGREVALKEVLSPEMRARFEREALITARLQHPAIVPIYEAATWPDGTAFYTMRLVPGETLAQAIDARGTLAARLSLLPHVIAVSEALAYAHARGVIHRDLKPQNVLIGAFGETVVIDWGLAKQRGGFDDERAAEGPLANAAFTHAGAVLGTPCFMSPEQARGEELDERTDVFALGALLYNLIAGAPPYWDRSNDSKELVAEVLARPPTPIGAISPGVPADLRVIVERAMARDLAERYADAGQVAAELRRFQAGQLLLSREYRLRDRVGHWIRRHRKLVAYGGAALVVLIAVGVVAIRNAVRAREAEREAETAFEAGELRGQRKLCAASSPELTSPWTAEAKALVHRRFAALDVGFAPQTLERIDRAFDRWTADLDAARELVCGAERREQIALELACLTERTRGARALIAQFHDADRATVLNAVAATESLPPIARCTAEAPTARAPVPDSPPVSAVRDLFARSHALIELGKARDALPLTQEAVKGADAIGDVGLRAAARVSLGAAQLATSDYDHATPTLEEALRLAEAARDDRTRAQAWVNLVRIAYLRGKHEQAALMEAPALGAAERIDDVYLQTEIMLFLGGAYGQLGKNAEAEAQFERAVKMRRAAFGDHDRRVAAALSSLGNALAMKGDLDRGITAHREAAEIAEAALGAAHPNVGIMIGNLGSDYTYAQRGAEAVAQFERSLAIAEGAYGSKHRDIAMALTNLGTAQLHAGQPEAALATFARAEAAWKDVNAKHPALAEVLCGRYLAHEALGKPASVADLETALDLGKGLPPFIRARIQLALGKASSGPRARELVKAAAAGFATSTLPLTQRELADANAWLVAHGGV
ncbi:serine/threonine-protein kinase [Polyangium sp. y55x31]|uniref:tetratricopeptide repeat protein n=1 Tax=Polyangium sp. y55x31 TaxID=3042688 RepID=UPI002482F14A|nr:serine/threonine-protein kinase [Polyangium sp. y55x31]MDI1476892.1 serine/threonine-protein kinase [Polyangium sp. y55x31]